MAMVKLGSIFHRKLREKINSEIVASMYELVKNQMTASTPSPVTVNFFAALQR
jgi:hypothetical protein